ncbi:MAG TPA: DUF2382 domain-containing protein [Flavisolibacter sp.]|nr:DUF2382 domain-containing protein [Flavisolibacter sp.]
MDKYHHHDNKDRENTTGRKPLVIPVVEEGMEIGKEVVETARIVVQTRIREEQATVNIPVISEKYEVRHIPVNQVFPEPPGVRHEGDTLIVPVIEEIVVVEKRYRVIEEVHLIKHKTETPFMQELTLRKGEVRVERTDQDGEKSVL